MDNLKETRWRQRYKNFQRAFQQLTYAVDRIDSLDDLSKEGLIQRFEYTLELSWKTLKDYLEAKEVQVKFPKDVIRQAFQAEIIANGELWLEMLNNRNLFSHTYNEEIFNEAIHNIVQLYYKEIEELYKFFDNEQ